MRKWLIVPGSMAVSALLVVAVLLPRRQSGSRHMRRP